MITDEMRATAEDRMQQTMRREPKAVRARYDRWRSRIVIRLETGLDLVLPKRLVEGLAQASDADLAEIEITPSGLGLHWPKLDADIYVPGLLEGLFGSRGWRAGPPDVDHRSKRRA
jgi:Protein of unknown function (DUF2442)